MNPFLLLAVLVLCTAIGDAQAPKQAPAKAPTPPLAPVTTATFFDHASVADVLARSGTLVNAPDRIVSGSHRDVVGQVEIHDKQTDVLYITDVGATFFTGGTMTGGRVTGSGQQLGAGITGGDPRKLVKGDVIVSPAGMPHWFKEVGPPVSYFVVKIVKP